MADWSQAGLPMHLELVRITLLYAPPIWGMRKKDVPSETEPLGGARRAEEFWEAPASLV